MKIYKNKYISLGIIFLICLFSISAFITIENNPIETEIQENPLPKLSAGEIDIITPENKTYTKAMSGYYPATYGFENDADGNLPSSWLAWPEGNLKVIGEKDGHKKIVEGYTQKSPVQNFGMINDFKNQTSGTIEFWIQSSVGSYFLMLTRDVADTASAFTIFQNKFQYYDGTFHEVMSWTANTWYHIKLVIDCESDTYDIYINNVLMKENAPFQFNVDKINRFRIYSCTESGSQGYLWVDAIGYSWDPNYYIGDNLEEGLLLSYENSTNLDWKGYSLDNAANKTILGNTTIPVPHNGTHSIQVFGNETMGTMYESEKRYFTMDYIPINIFTPENITYTEPMSGFYPATYGFENDAEYSNPSGWTIIENLEYIVDVINEKNGHNKVVKFYDDYSADYALLWKVFDFQVSGTIEWYAMASQTDKLFHMGWKDAASSTYAFMISFYTNGYIRRA